MRRSVFKLTIFLLVLTAATVFAELASAEDNRNPTVGAAGWIDEIKLPGTELAAAPLDEKSPIVVRVARVFPHGDSFRYDLRFHGLEPGEYDLSKWLLRKDGSSTDDLPPIHVEVVSLLPPGQIEPNQLELGWIPRLGGYRRVAIVVGVFWLAVLLGLVFLGRKKAKRREIAESKRTLADLLHERLEAAAANEMSLDQYAELERMLLAFWRRKLGLESISLNQALPQIFEHPDAGPLMKQLEQWMHSPTPDRNIDLRKLVEPFRGMPEDTSEFQS